MAYNCTRAYEGTRGSAGVVPIRLGGLPAHLQSDEYVPVVDNMLFEGMVDVTAGVEITGTATVVLQGNAGDPDTGVWFNMHTPLTATGVAHFSDGAARFVRANVTSYTSGTVNVQIAAVG